VIPLHPIVKPLFIVIGVVCRKCLIYKLTIRSAIFCITGVIERRPDKWHCYLGSDILLVLSLNDCDLFAVA